MKQIQMVDLGTQYLRIKDEIDQAVAQVIDASAFINGTAVKKFEAGLADFLDCKYTVGCGNGTDALQIALMALGLKPGDEVITTPFTFVATAEVIALLGLKPVFVDIDPDTFNLDVSKVEAAMTNRTRCIIPVHLFGQAVDMESLLAVAKEHSLIIVEDNAQAIGCTYTFNEGTTKRTGTIGDVGCLSFYPSKNLSCFGDGGALTINSEELYDQARMIVNHGSSERYYHDVVGVNSRLDSIQAAVLNVKLGYLNTYNAARQKVAAFYNDALSSLDEVVTPKVAKYSNHVYHQYTLRVQDRDELKAYLQEQDIPSMVYYPVPLHLQKAYSGSGYVQGDFPVTEQATEEVLSLPIHTEMETEQLEYITEHIVKFYKKKQ